MTHPTVPSRTGSETGKRPTGRARLTPALVALRLWFRMLDRIAPDVAERRAAKLFLTPRRPRHARQFAGRADSRSFVLEVAGFRLAAWSWGEGPSVLLVHGWSGCAADMEGIALALVDAGFRIVLLDLPGHGRSPGSETSMVEWLRVLRATDDVLGPFHAVVGHSLGAAAVTLALSEGLRANAAVLVAPPADSSYFIARIVRFLGLRPERRAGMARHVVRRAGRTFEEVDAARAARSLSIPALILHDPADTEVPWTHGRAIADAWEGSRLESCANTGHTRILIDARAVDAIVAFVTGAALGRAGRIASAMHDRPAAS